MFFFSTGVPTTPSLVYFPSDSGGKPTQTPSPLRRPLFSRGKRDGREKGVNGPRDYPPSLLPPSFPSPRFPSVGGSSTPRVKSLGVTGDALDVETRGLDTLGPDHGVPPPVSPLHSEVRSVLLCPGVESRGNGYTLGTQRLELLPDTERGHNREGPHPPPESGSHSRRGRVGGRRRRTTL